MSTKSELGEKVEGVRGQLDLSKLPLELVPIEAIVGIALALKAGCVKRKRTTAPDYPAIQGATNAIYKAQRHMLAALSGQVHDQECSELLGVGVPHIACAMADLAIALAAVEREQDDMKGDPANPGDRWVLESLGHK